MTPPAPRARPDAAHQSDRDLGFIGVGALASALVQAFARVWPPHRFHLSPRGSEASLRLQQHYGARRHDANQAVLDACRRVVIGVRPHELDALAAQLRPAPEHRLFVLAAGTPLNRLQTLFAPAQVIRVMTGLAVAGGNSAISLFPRALEAEALFAPACASVIGFDDELQFDASILAVCANAWWLDQLGTLTDWMVRATGMRADQAQALLGSNLADAATLLRLHPRASARELARGIASPGTYTAAGLDLLQQTQAHQSWEQALAVVLARLQEPSTSASSSADGA